MTFVLPPNGQWTQKNVGDATGSLWSSFNLDLTVKQGDTKITRLNTNQSTSSDLANLGVPIGFARIDNGAGGGNYPYYTVAGTRVFKQSIGGVYGSFTQDSQTGTPTTCSSDASDIAAFNGYIYVTTASNTVYKTNGTGSWATFTAGGSDTTAHKLCQYGNRMYMQRVYSQIISWDTADTVATSGQYTLTLPNSATNLITFMCAASDKIWIGTLNADSNSNGAIYSWDGSSGNPVRYKLNSTGAMAGIVKDDILYVMDNDGRLLAFNGGTFIEIAKLPNFMKLEFKNSKVYSNSRWIHPNGMAIINNKINILVNTQLNFNTTLTEEMCPSGIWEYDKDIGLYHKYSVSYLDRVFETITDYGQSRIETAGGLIFAKNNTSNSASNGTLLMGCAYYSNSSTIKYGIFTDDNNDLYLKAGYLATTKIPSSGIIDTWQRFVLKYNNLISSSNKIVAKYRLTDYNPIEATITWTSTTTFTTTTDLSAYWTSGTGFECEIVQGTGAGMCSHITSITGSGTYTVTVDEVHTGVTSGTAIARFQKWIKLGSVTDTTSTFKIMQFPASAASNFIQLKVWMIMYGSDELKEIDIQSVVSQDLK